MNHRPIQNITIRKANADGLQHADESLVVEEPLEIEIHFDSADGQVRRNAGVIMRTPGYDEELALGFLFSEGVITAEKGFLSVERQGADKLKVKLPGSNLRSKIPVQRETILSSSCGVCGHPAIDELMKALPFPVKRPSMNISRELIFGLQEKMREGQTVFEATGGIHAAGLFDSSGKLMVLREDVGRHNAVDKLVGFALTKGILPLKHMILLLSGRAGFELLQKAAMAGIPVVVSVGAPSSLAVDTAREAGITLLGFLRGNRFNIYTQFDNLEKDENKDQGKFNTFQA